MQLKATLGKEIKVGQQIKLDVGWRVVQKVVQEGVITSAGLVPFGAIVRGWKAR